MPRAGEQILDKYYISKLPEEAKEKDLFYVRPLEKFLVWVSHGTVQLLSRNTVYTQKIHVLWSWNKRLQGKLYRIVGIFRGRKLMRIDQKGAFCGENLRGMLKRLHNGCGMPKISSRNLVVQLQNSWMFSLLNVFRYIYI